MKETVCFSPSLCRPNKGCSQLILTTSLLYLGVMCEGRCSQNIFQMEATLLELQETCCHAHVLNVALLKNPLWMSGFDFQYSKNYSLFKNIYYFQKSSWATERMPQWVACSLWPVCWCRSALMYVIAPRGILRSHSFVEYLFHKCGKFIRDNLTEFVGNVSCYMANQIIGAS